MAMDEVESVEDGSAAIDEDLELDGDVPDAQPPSPETLGYAADGSTDISAELDDLRAVVRLGEVMTMQLTSTSCAGAQTRHDGNRRLRAHV